MTKTANLYTNGTWFNVPLRTGGFARGLVSCSNGKGIAFGYFFGPKLDVKAEELPVDLDPENRVLWGKFGDLGLLNGEWSIIGRSSNWSYEDWPMPPLIRVDESVGLAYISIYDQTTFSLVSESICDPNLKDSYPFDRMMGYGSVEIRLTKLLEFV